MLHGQIRPLRVGDRIVGERHRPDVRRRACKVVEVRKEPGRQRCRVLWDDGHETFLYPGIDVSLDRRSEHQEEIE